MITDKALSDWLIMNKNNDDIENIEWLRCAIRRNHDSIILNYSIITSIELTVHIESPTQSKKVSE